MQRAKLLSGLDGGLENSLPSTSSQCLRYRLNKEKLLNCLKFSISKLHL